MFRHPLWLGAGLLLLPAAWALLRWGDARRRRVGEAMGGPAILARTVTGERPNFSVIRLMAIVLLVLALAGPQFGIELVETRSDARQAVIAVDVSLSMLTPDVKPNRLERAKSSLSLLIDQLRGERLGVVAFAGDAVTVCPLTQDADAAKQLLGALEVGAVPTPGTAIGGALRTSVAMLGRYPGGKAVILLTDGEDHKSDPLGAAREAAAAGVRVYAVGIGTPDGEPIPGAGGAYHKNAQGGTVVSRLDESMLAQVSRETGGAYYRTTPGSDEIADIAKRILELDAAKGVSGTANLWRNRYAWPAAAAFLLILLELLLPLIPALRPLASTRAAKAAALAAGTWVALAAPAAAAGAEGSLRAGNRLYVQEEYEGALERYGEAAVKAPKDPRPAFNAGGALYRLEKLDDATAMYEAVAARKDLPAVTRSAALYNLGNARFRSGDFPNAAAAFRGALALSPGDPAARHNLAVTMQRLKNPPPPKKGPQDPKKDDPPKPEDAKDKPQGGGAEKEQPKSPPKTRPEDQLTKEEAERILRAVAEREKQSQRQAREGEARRAQGKPPTGEDW
ncbi:MAG: VWA domain-containing protein [Elusimicrobiota bacterium]|nr:VWA domain-containing protein [Elusimicrobiota bacterium]